MEIRLFTEGDRGSRFFELCGSPIKPSTPNYDHAFDAEMTEKLVNASPVQKPRRRRSSIDVVIEKKTNVHGIRRRKSIDCEPNPEPPCGSQYPTVKPVPIGRKPKPIAIPSYNINPSNQIKQVEGIPPHGSPLRLDGARRAKIPLFLSGWFAKAEKVSDATPVGSDTSSDENTSTQLTTIDMRELKMGAIIGEGAFGKVYKALWKNRRVAVKVLLRQDLSDDVVREFEAEAKIMSMLNHPNICMLLGACLEPKNRALVMEFADQGSLWKVLRVQANKLTPEIKGRIVRDVARGMAYLHEFQPPILHRDMKSPNLLVENDYSIKIADFGLARMKAQIQTMTGNCGTVQWMAPEVLGNCKYTEKADVFSFGVVVWEIFSGECPYEGMSQIQAALGVLNHDLRPRIPKSCPRFFSRLMRLCWERDPKRRPPFSEIVALLDRM